MSEAEQGTDVGIDSRIKLEDTVYSVWVIETGTRTKKAEVPSDRFENNLRIRPLDRYINLTVEEFRRGDVIREEWEVLRMKSRERHWNVFTKYAVTKEQA